MNLAKQMQLIRTALVLGSACPLLLTPTIAETIVVPSKANATIAKAMITAQSGDTVVVENGVYGEKILIKPGVTLKARSQFGAILDGNGKACIVTLGGNCCIWGFEIRRGTIGIFSNTLDNSIVSCRITAMTQSAISCSGQLPKIEDNILVHNKGSGLQCWDVRSTSASINHNTIAYNENNGIAMGGNSTAVIENNVIAFNERLGIKINGEAVTCHLMKNVFFENGSMSYINLEGNLTCDPKFIDPKKMHFALQPDSPCKNKSLNEEDPGARNGI
jgi:hypothetical protein